MSGNLDLKIKIAAVLQGMADIKALAVDVQTLAGAGSKAAPELDKLGKSLATTTTTAKPAAGELAKVGQESRALVPAAKGASSDVATLAANLQTLRTNTAAAGQVLSDMKGRLALATAGVAALVFGLGPAAAAASAFGKSMAEVSTLLDDGVDLQPLEEGVRSLAREFGGEVQTNAKALYDIISAGAADGAAAIDTLTAANKLAMGGVTEVSVAANGLTSVMNAYGKEAGTAAAVSDAFFVAVKAGKTTVGELSASIGQVAPIAAEAGVSLDELMAATAALTSVNGDTAASVTQVRGAITSVIKPSSEAQRIAHELGLEFSAAALQSKGFAGFLDEVREKTGGNIETMAGLFGSVEGLNGVLTLTGRGADKFGETLAAMGNKAGATDAAVAKMMNTPAVSAARFRAAMADVQLSLGQVVTAFTPLLNALTGMLNLFNGLPPSARTVIASLGLLLVALPPIIFAIKTLAEAFVVLRGAMLLQAAVTALQAGMTLMTGAFAAFTARVGIATGALRVFKLALASTGIGLLVVGLGELATWLMKSKESADAAAGGMDGLGSASDEAIAKAAAAAADGNAKIQEAASKAVVSINGAITTLKPVLAELDGMIGALQQKVTQSGERVVSLVGQMGSGYQGLTQIVQTELTAQIAQVQARYQAERQAIQDSGVSQGQAMQQQTAALTSAVAAQVGVRRDALAQELGIIEQQRSAQLAAINSAQLTEQQRERAVLQIEQNILKAKQDAIDRNITAYRQHIDQLNAEEQRHLAEVQRIQDEIEGVYRSAEDRIRDIRRGGMTDHEATEDRKRQVTELQSAARDAIARGEFDKAKSYGEQAMQLSEQVANAETSAKKRAEQEYANAEQRKTQALQQQETAREQLREANLTKEGAAREQAVAAAQKSYDAATAAYRKALAEQQQADRDAATSKGEVERAIGQMRTTQDLLVGSLKAEGAAHEESAAKFAEKRASVSGDLQTLLSEQQELRAKFAEGLDLKIRADAADAEAEIDKLRALVEEQEYLLAVRGDVQKVMNELDTVRTRLAKGETVEIDATIDKALAALGKVRAAAADAGKAEMVLAVDKALGSVGEVRSAITKLNGLKTASQHTVSSNVADVRGEIDSLNGRDTSSTHTIYVQKVEQNALGGLAGAAVQHYARGGRVFPAMRRGRVPGSGNRDTVPRTLEAGAFVLRKAAVRYYGESGLKALVDGARGRLGAAPRGPAGRVPAMLMPGERVFDRGTVARLGTGFFEGLNRMAIPPAVAPLVPHFAQGGQVQTGSLLDGPFFALYARAEAAGGVRARKDLEQLYKQWASRQSRIGTGNMDAVSEILDLMTEFVERVENRAANKTQSEADPQASTSSSSPRRGSMSGNTQYRAPGAGAQAPGPHGVIPDRVYRVDLTHAGRTHSLYGAPGDVDGFLAALESAQRSAS